MQYQDAVNKKAKIGNEIMHGGAKLDVLIAPSDFKDRLNFLRAFRLFNLNDASCLKFSNNNDFVVIGLGLDYNDVLHYVIP